jgi:hypothetical protein
MVNPVERKIRWLLTGAGAGCFVLLLLLEIGTEGAELSPLDLAVDALTILLTIGAAVGVALVAQRIQASTRSAPRCCAISRSPVPRAMAGATRCAPTTPGSRTAAISS